jgi:hypothetical protein
MRKNSLELGCLNFALCGRKIMPRVIVAMLFVLGVFFAAVGRNAFALSNAESSDISQQQAGDNDESISNNDDEKVPDASSFDEDEKVENIKLKKAANGDSEETALPATTITDEEESALKNENEEEYDEVVSNEPVKKEPIREKAFGKSLKQEKQAKKDVSIPVNRVIVSPAPEKTYYNAESMVVNDLDADGIILGDKDKKLLISAGDTVYLNIGNDRVKPGTQCFVFRKVQPVSNPEDKREIIGYEIRRTGKLEITRDLNETTSTAKVLISYEPIEIGDIVQVINPEK